MHWTMRLRRLLLMPFACRWNDWVRDWTADLELRFRWENRGDIDPDNLDELTKAELVRLLRARLEYLEAMHDAAVRGRLSPAGYSRLERLVSALEAIKGRIEAFPDVGEADAWKASLTSLEAHIRPPARIGSKACQQGDPIW
jgi:hypothetical protein